MNKEYLEVNGDPTNVAHFLIFDQRMLLLTVWFYRNKQQRKLWQLSWQLEVLLWKREKRK